MAFSQGVIPPIELDCRLEAKVAVRCVKDTLALIRINCRKMLNRAPPQRTTLLSFSEHTHEINAFTRKCKVSRAGPQQHQEQFVVPQHRSLVAGRCSGDKEQAAQAFFEEN